MNERNNKKKNFLRITIPIVLMCLFLLVTVFGFRRRIVETLEADTESKLDEITIQMKRAFEKELNGRLNNLEILAASVEVNMPIDTILYTIDKNVPSFKIEQIGVVSLTGEGLARGEDLPYFLDSFRGSKKVAYLAESGFSEESCILLSVPLYHGKNISGAVYEVISGEEMENIFYATIFDGEGFTYCSGAGFSTPIIPASVNPQNAKIAVELMDNEKNQQSIESLNRKMFYEKSGVDIFYHGTESYYIASVALEVMPGWYSMSVVNTQVIAKKLNFVLFLSTLGFVFLTLLFLFLYFVLSSAEIKNKQKQHKLVYYDTLTELLKFEGLQLYSTGKGKEPHVLVLFNIKNFHTINLVMGENYCDQLLKKIAVVLRISASHESEEFACRVKDDIFLLYLKNSANLEGKIRAVIIACEEQSDKMPIHITASVCPLAAGEAVTTAALNRCFFAHASGISLKDGKTVFYYDENMQKVETENRLLENDLPKAIENKEFLIYLQPKINLKTKQWCGAEALIRWQHPEKGLIPPARFIPLFEKSGCIAELDLYVFEELCAIIGRWQGEGRKILPISVNLSRQHLGETGLADDLEAIVNQYNVPIEYIELELTESAFFEDADKLTAVVDKLHEKGFHVSIDDFGTGYSSLSCLTELSVDLIKLDKSFIDSWEKNSVSSVMNGIIKMANDLNIVTLIEGIETEEQSNLLSGLDCAIGQGYYFSKAITVCEYEKLVFGGGAI